MIWSKEVKSLYLKETDENYLPVDRPLLRKRATVNYNRRFFSGNVVLLSIQHHEHNFENCMYMINVGPVVRLQKSLLGEMTTAKNSRLKCTLDVCCAAGNRSTERRKVYISVDKFDEDKSNAEP